MLIFCEHILNIIAIFFEQAYISENLAKISVTGAKCAWNSKKLNDNA